MPAIGLWNPVYDQRLTWVGVRLETDAVVPVAREFFVDMSSAALAVEGIQDKLFFVGADVLIAGDPSLAPPFPPPQLVVVLNETFLSNRASIKACLAWRDQGMRLARAGLDIVSGPSPDMVSVRILDAAAARATFSEQTLLDAGRSGTKLFAQGLGSMELFDWCAAAGFSYFTFGGLDYPEHADKPREASSLPLMRLLSLVATDAQTAKMEEVFKLDPKLAFELLRLVNSTANGIRTEIDSFAQAIMVLGRRQLQRWLQLLMFSQRKKGDESPNILMQRAAERGRMMELLAVEGNETASREQAFMVGVFSVLDVLMATPLPELLKSISLPQPVEQALLGREGRLGALLELVCAAESSDFAEVQRLLPGLGIAPGTLSRSQLDAIFWALKVIGSK